MARDKKEIATSGSGVVRCAIYTRKSTEEGLDQDFNSLDAQREAGEAYIRSQASEGWTLVPSQYDDGGYTGANIERPGMKRLLDAIQAKKVNCVVVYKVDRLSRSIRDFAKIMETFEKHGAQFVSVTQQFNTTTSLGRLTLNILLSFAQFEREIISERTRDKQVAARRKGKWTGGLLVLGYNLVDSRLIVNDAEADRVRQIFNWYLEGRSVFEIVAQCEKLGWRNKEWTTINGRSFGGYAIRKCHLYKMLANPLYAGQIRADKEIVMADHAAIIDPQAFALTQQKLKENTRHPGTKNRRSIDALLRGLLYCSVCGSAMSPSYTSKETRRYRYYSCLRAVQKLGTRCTTRAVPAPMIEKAVVESVRKFAHTPEVVRQTAQAARERLEEHHAGIRDQIKEANANVRNAKTQLGRTRSSNPDRNTELRDGIAAEEKRADGLRARIDRGERLRPDERTVRDELSSFDELWGSMAFDQQIALLKLIVERVGYDDRTDKVKVTFTSTNVREACQKG